MADHWLPAILHEVLVAVKLIADEKIELGILAPKWPRMAFSISGGKSIMEDIKPGDLRVFATELANIAITIVSGNRTGQDVEIKKDGSPVTGVDLAVEAALREQIESEYPDHGVLGEELPAHNADAEWIWVIDPIDGTNQYAAGLPNFGCLIALCRHGVPNLGVICQPNTREIYLGVLGLGAWRNGEPIMTTRQKTLSETNLCITDPDAFDNALRPGMECLRRASRWNVYEGGCLSFGALAAGRIGVSVYGSNLENFDICALVPVVEAAGGVITDWQGGILTIESSGEIVASANRALHAEVLEKLNGGGRQAGR